MSLKQVIEICEMLEAPRISEEEVKRLFLNRGLLETEIEITEIDEGKGTTKFFKFCISGKEGQLEGGSAPTLGIIGRLGGIGARPLRIGLVSDADGALAAMSSALKIVDLRQKGDVFPGDVIVTTHLCPHSPVVPHDPVPFMDAPVSIATMNQYEVDERMDAILSIDATKGNRVINNRGFAISPTVKDGYILRVSEDLLDVMQNVTGKLPVVFPISTQDITPYGNGLYHMNSIMQPATAADVPVVGVALTTDVAVPGCATGANQYSDLEMTVRFAVEVAKAFGEDKCSFYDKTEFKTLQALYGSLGHLRTPGKT